MSCFIKNFVDSLFFQEVIGFEICVCGEDRCNEIELMTNHDYDGSDSGSGDNSGRGAASSLLQFTSTFLLFSGLLLALAF